MKNSSVDIVWFKRDLRVTDHAALLSAARSGHAIIPLYVVEPNYWKQSFASRRQWNFIHDCLTDLRKKLSELGAPLIVRVGSVSEVLQELNKKHKIHTLHAHEESGNMWTYKRDIEVARFCKSISANYIEYPYNGVIRRLESRDAWARQRNIRMAEPLIEIQTGLNQADIDIGIIPPKDDPIFGSDNRFSIQAGGRASAESLLNGFLETRSSQYLYTISKPGQAEEFSSRLSPYLTWGVLSSREVVKALQARKANLTAGELPRFKRSLSAFTSRLSWRCHFIQKIEDQPSIEFECMHPAFEGMRGEPNQELLELWQQGLTGYPLIDACMRCLNQTGWLPFRMRAMLVSFASYNLWLDWRITGKHLARMFTDYEPGIHYSQMQMQSGVTGINAIRIYNPIKQSMDHDPNGRFIRKYVPELRSVSEDWIHEPWNMPLSLQQNFGVIIGENYPKPCVDRVASMRFARAKLKEARSAPQFRAEAKKVYEALGSRKRSPARRKSVRVTRGKSEQLSLF